MGVRTIILLYTYTTVVFLLCCVFTSVSTLSTDQSHYSYQDVENTRQRKWAPMARPPKSTGHSSTPPSRAEDGIERGIIWGRQPLRVTTDVPSPIVEVGWRSNFRTYPRSTNRRDRIVFPIKNQTTQRRT
ncbi:PREDICTED: uncharacterized protein LOC108977762 [Bactrocera latifrons]|uniref:uncharacterized protein LOC108977762 n=1 Tax=Bactrocera latifrons TaxID=174628 RepID=UPI0008DE2B97|nr:PREDICTED: uncharacterized protein LOC108977762 [Bactrocera latifrons]